MALQHQVVCKGFRTRLVAAVPMSKDREPEVLAQVPCSHVQEKRFLSTWTLEKPAGAEHHEADVLLSQALRQDFLSDFKTHGTKVPQHAASSESWRVAWISNTPQTSGQYLLPSCTTAPKKCGHPDELCNMRLDWLWMSQMLERRSSSNLSLPL